MGETVPFSALVEALPGLGRQRKDRRRVCVSRSLGLLIAMVVDIHGDLARRTAHELLHRLVPSFLLPRRDANE